MAISLILILFLSLVMVWLIGLLVADERQNRFNLPLFFIFFFAIWAAGSWLSHPGPMNLWEQSVPFLLVGIFLFLFALAITPKDRLKLPQNISPIRASQLKNEIAFGIFTWLLLLFLFVLLLIKYSQVFSTD